MQGRGGCASRQISRAACNGRSAPFIDGRAPAPSHVRARRDAKTSGDWSLRMLLLPGVVGRDTVSEGTSGCGDMPALRADELQPERRKPVPDRGHGELPPCRTVEHVQVAGRDYAMVAERGVASDEGREVRENPVRGNVGGTNAPLVSRQRMKLYPAAYMDTATNSSSTRGSGGGPVPMPHLAARRSRAKVRRDPTAARGASAYRSRFRCSVMANEVRHRLVVRLPAKRDRTAPSRPVCAAYRYSSRPAAP